MNNSSTQLTKAQFWYLLSLFPNLQYFDIKNSEHKNHYMQLLCDCREPEQLPLLDSIDLYFEEYTYTEEDFHMLCFATYYLFRRTLKSMKVIFFNRFNEGGKFMNSLPEFKNLRSLHITNHVDQNLTLFHLLQECPNLSSLVYESVLPVTENEAQQLKTMQQKLQDQNLSMPQFLKNLERIELQLRKPATPYIDFFANNCPQSLKSIVLSFWKTSHYLKSEREAALILDLCKNLQKYDSVKLKIGKTRLINNSSIHTFDQILNALIGEKEFYKHSAIYTFSDDSDMDVDISVVGSELSYSRPMNQHFIGREFDPPVPSNLNQLAKVDNVTVDVGRASVGNLLTNYLKYLQMYYTQLKQFRVKSCNHTMFLAECLDPSNPSLENMTSIWLNDYDFSEKWIDLLTEYFPNVKVLSFTCCPQWQITRKSFNLSKLKCLQTLTIDILGGRLSMQSPIFLEYTDSRHSIQYLIDKWNAKDEIANRIESMSVDLIQKHKTRNTYKGYFTICLETSNPIAKIEVTVNGKAWATLDL
ncbi:unnamed protein product [Mucor hiemalis]